MIGLRAIKPLKLGLSGIKKGRRFSAQGLGSIGKTNSTRVKLSLNAPKYSAPKATTAIYR